MVNSSLVMLASSGLEDPDAQAVALKRIRFLWLLERRRPSRACFRSCQRLYTRRA